MMGKYGFVKITAGKHKNRVGYYDDDHSDKKAIVYWGDGLTSSNRHDLIRYDYLDDEITTIDILTRMDVINRKKFEFRRGEHDPYEYIDLLNEYTVLTGLLTERYDRVRDEKDKGEEIFLSHASEDKAFVRALATDLSELGYKPWLDEWQIKVGENIPKKINHALDNCKSFIIVLSQNSAKSKWVGEEFYAAYGSIFSDNEKRILPILLEECEIPFLLRQYKYANFKGDYIDGFKELRDAL